MRENALKQRGRLLRIEGKKHSRKYQSLNLAIPKLRHHIADSPMSLLSIRKPPRALLAHNVNSQRDRSHLLSLEVGSGLVALSERTNPSVNANSVRKHYPALSLASIRLPQLAKHKDNKNNQTTIDTTQIDIKGSSEIAQRSQNETIAILSSMQELCKLLKFRLDDITTLERHINTQTGTLKLALQFVDKVVLDIESRESARVALETQKIAAVEGMRTDDKDTKKAIAKNVKKILADFERRYFFKVPPKVMSSAEHLKEVMQGESPRSETKIKISHNKILATVLQYAFREPKSNPEFIFQACALYTRLIVKIALKEVVDMYNREAMDGLRRRWARQIPTVVLWKSIERIKRECDELCKAKVVSLLKKCNKIACEATKEYRAHINGL
eukprot:TRINITY_DN4399_c0_g1_i1.p1 TRINITY_DN4399_c0_g1~~TRINITY_DN4399_c0_g1_i1.p1  ORF type:complete len:386 (-),score=56.64 TRINITY_DN4399_c0_g1_i1:67-1224(-)